MPNPVITNTKPVYLLSDVHVADAPDDASKAMPRKFSGIANSGKPWSDGWDMYVVDFADISYKDKTPVLLNHDRTQLVGFGELSIADNKLNIKGVLLDNECGNQVADASDAGFPWQMSAHIDTGSAEELANGETATVNGQTVTGPITILKNCTVPEISFTPTGVDTNTSAVVLGDNGNSNPQPKPLKDKDAIMSPEEIAALQAENAKLKKENQDLLDEIEKLKEAAAEADKEAHEAAVDAQLSQAGFTKSEDGKTWQGLSESTHKMLLSADIDTAKGVIADLKPADSGQQDTPSWLLSEQHPPKDGQGQIQTAVSPLVADAQARNS